MKPYVLESDINVICVTASSFPEGIKAAYDKLSSLIGSGSTRRFFGISYGDGNKNIIYKAAAQEASVDEAAKLGCERFTIKKGEYISEYIADFMNHIPKMGESFREMCKDPRIDSNGYCVEMYTDNGDVICMVKLDDTKM